MIKQMKSLAPPKMITILYQEINAMTADIKLAEARWDEYQDPQFKFALRRASLMYEQQAASIISEYVERFHKAQADFTKHFGPLSIDILVTFAEQHAKYVVQI